MDVEGTQQRHDGQVEEGEACQLHLRGQADEGRGHRQQHAHRPINLDPAPFQDLPYRAETVLSRCEMDVSRDERSEGRRRRRQYKGFMRGGKMEERKETR